MDDKAKYMNTPYHININGCSVDIRFQKEDHAQTLDKVREILICSERTANRFKA